MFGKVLRIDNNVVTVENMGLRDISSLMNVHVIFETDLRKTVGEIIYIDSSVVRILLVGEIINNNFISGVIRKPSGVVNIRIITMPELELIFGKRELSQSNLNLGKSAIYSNLNISVPLNSLFANHSAIIGNTGSGKSCGLARILQNLFLVNPLKPKNAHVVLFDAYGEYVNTFNKMNEVGLKTVNYTTNVERANEQQLAIPLYFLDVDDLAILLQVTNGEQIPVLDKTLRLVSIFNSSDPVMKDYKNDIIANCLMDILTSGKSSSHMRDQIIAVLSHYNTETLNLDSIIHQPGYDRTLRQCLLIDEQGKMSSIFEVVKFLEQFEKINLEEVNVVRDFTYTLDDLYYALEFALISEGNLNNDEAYKRNNILKTRLQTIINGNEKNIFSTNEYMSKESYVQNMFANTQLVNINLSNVDDRFAKVITKLLSKLLFNYTTSLTVRGSFSVNIILEEAHRYVQNDNDIDVIGYNIFDRITKEGRKYGTLLTFITQRPSELSKTALSQCTNYIVFRIFHPEDLDIVKSMSSNVADETLEQIKNLNPGTAFCFGTGFKIPSLVMFNLPNPLPQSTSVDISSIWYKEDLDGRN